MTFTPHSDPKPDLILLVNHNRIFFFKNVIFTFNRYLSSQYVYKATVVSSTKHSFKSADFTLCEVLILTILLVPIETIIITGMTAIEPAHYGHILQQLLGKTSHLTRSPIPALLNELLNKCVCH